MYFVKVLVLILTLTCLIASSESEYKYLYIGKNVNYAAARRLCGSHEDGPMTLAMPKTEEEVNAVKKYLNEVAKVTDKSVWIGLNDEEKEGEFRFEDGTKMDKENKPFEWSPGNPNDDHNEDCVDIRIYGKAGWEMNDNTCDSRHGGGVDGFLCQKEVVPPPPETTRKRVIRTTTEPPSNTTTIVVIIVATLFLLGLAVGCMVYYMKTSKKKRHSEGDSEGDAEDGTSVYSYAASTSRASTASRGFGSSMAAGSSRASSRGMRSSSSFGNSRKSSSMGGSSRGSRASYSGRKSAASIGSSIGSQGRTSRASRKHSAV